MNTTRVRQALDLARVIVTDQMTCVEERNGIKDPRHLEKLCDLDLLLYRRYLRAVKLIDEALKEIE